MKLASIFRYPVKSMGGHEMSSTTIGERGIPGDRAWAVRDEVRGNFKAGKRHAILMEMQARFLKEPGEEVSPPVAITLPDGTIVKSDDPNVNQILSDTLGTPVALWPLLPKEQLDHYRKSPPPPGTDVRAAMQELFARTDEEGLPDLSSFPKFLAEFDTPPGTYFDAYPILLMSHGSLTTMQARSETSDYDIRRFRPNLLIDIDGEFPEEAWVGQQLRLGSVELMVDMACPRCVMTTHGFSDLPKDPTVMRELVKHNNGNLGIYCKVTRAGKVAVGDRLEVI